MANPVALFNDGAAYERMMGVWSRIAGEDFLAWLDAPRGGDWIDVGCGNGAFTRLLMDRCAPASVLGIDPSEGQLAYARETAAGTVARFEKGGAFAIPAKDAQFDAAVMALVLFFVPEPAQGVAEMRRVTRPGGLVVAYCWDIPGGGFPLEDCWDEIRKMGHTPIHPPSAQASRVEVMRDLWVAAGLQDVKTKVLHVARDFATFDEYWDIAQASSVGQQVAKFDAATVSELKRHVRARLKIDGAGRVRCTAFANAVKGTVPA
jgi:ubiquinone/menaquinone biosynthesis C-methylase UbiE